METTNDKKWKQVQNATVSSLETVTFNFDDGSKLFIDFRSGIICDKYFLNIPYNEIRFSPEDLNSVI